MPDDRADRVSEMRGRLAVVVRGAWGGVALEGNAMLARRDDALIVELGEQQSVLPTVRLVGLAWRPPTLALWGDQGAIELAGAPELEGLAQLLTTQAYAFPELTRTLHALGSHRARPGAEHDRFFDGLMRARRFAEETRGGELDARLAAFSGRRLSEGFHRAFQDFAMARFPRSAPDRRAMVAELQDLAADLNASLAAVDAAADDVRSTGEEARVGAWRVWTLAARRTFEAADRVWLMALPVLSVPLAPRRSLWRRMLFLRSVLSAIAISGAASAGLGA